MSHLGHRLRCHLDLHPPGIAPIYWSLTYIFLLLAPAVCSPPLFFLSSQYSFPFDPSLDFHNYTLYWGPDVIAWAIDGRPVRITKRQPGKPFVSTSPMRVYGSIWDSSSWSQLKSNYSNGPISMHYADFDIRGCGVAGPDADVSRCKRVAREKKRPWNRRFSRRHLQKMERFRKRHVTLSIPWVPIPPPYIPPPEVDYNSTSSENGTYADEGSFNDSDGGKDSGGERRRSAKKGGSSGSNTKRKSGKKNNRAKGANGKPKRGSDKSKGSNKGGRDKSKTAKSSQSGERSSSNSINSSDERNSDIDIRSSIGSNSDFEGGDSDKEGASEGEDLDSVTGSSIRSIGGNMYTINSDGSMRPAEERRR